jgi:hypothetical protein
MSLIAMVGGSFVAAVGWIRVSQLGQHPLNKSEEIALWIQSVMFSLLALLAVLGFVGCLVKSRGMVSSFAVILAIHLGFSVASGIFAIYMVFRQSPEEAISQCVNGSTDPQVTESCKTGLNIIKGVLIAVYVVAWLLQLYAYFIVEWYVDQLDDEEISKHTVMPRGMGQQFTPPYGFGPTYVFNSPPHAQQNVTASLPSDLPSGTEVPNVRPGRDPSNLV